jgi:hypothetical protein
MSDPPKHVQLGLNKSVIEERVKAAEKMASLEEEKWSNIKQQHIDFVENMEDALNHLTSIQTKEEFEAWVAQPRHQNIISLLHDTS